MIFFEISRFFSKVCKIDCLRKWILKNIGLRGIFLERKIGMENSPSFTLKFLKCTIDMNFQTLPNGRTSGQVYLQLPLNAPPPTVHSCSYYILNEATGTHQKLVNGTPFLTEWFKIDIENDRMEFMVVIVVDFEDSPTLQTECWLEGTTESLNNIRMCHSSGY